MSDDVSKIKIQVINGFIVAVSVPAERSIFLDLKSISRGSECFENSGKLGKKF